MKKTQETRPPTALRRLGNFSAHLIYWGIGTPCVLAIGVLIFGLVRLLSTYFMEWVQVGLIVLAVIVLIGTIGVAWHFAGVKAGYIKEDGRYG